MTRKALFLAAASLAAMSVAPAALAQQGRSMSMGQSVTADLSVTDPVAEGDFHYDDYTVRLQAGQGTEIRMGSEAFDTYLEIGRGAGSGFTVLDSDDDGAMEGTNSRLRFRADEAGTYTVRARSFSPEGRGVYTLSVTERVMVPAPTPIPLSFGQERAGRLAQGGPVAEDAEDAPYAYYTFEAEADGRYVITMSSSDFDSYVEVGRPGDEYFEAFASDDDSGGELNARALFQAPEAGTYTIRARALGADGFGAYTVGVSEFVVPPAPRPSRIRVGNTVTGSLDSNDPVHEAFKRYDDYVLSGRAGQTVTVNLSSTDFDSYLIAGVAGPTGFATAQSNDDAITGSEEGGLDSQIVLTFQRAGEVIIRATSFGDGSEGGYTLTVE